MTAPTPRAFKARLKDVARILPVLAMEYEWVYGVAHDRSVRDEARVTVKGPNKPTESVVMSKARMRRQLERVEREVKSVDSQLRELENILAKCLEDDEPRERPEGHYTRPASPTDIRESHEAQVRRFGRGERVP